MNRISTTHQLGIWLGTEFTEFFCPERVAVVLEGNIIINLPTLADAFIIFFFALILDDTVILGLLTINSNIRNHTSGVERFVEWCDEHHLQINVKKIKKS